MKMRKVTIKDVALKANVSKATVSYVLNDIDKVSEETKKRVLDAIEELGYVPSTTARELAKQNLSSTEKNPANSFIEESPFYQEFMDAFIQTKIGKLSNETKNKLSKTIGDKGYLPSVVLDRLMKNEKKTIALFMDMERDFRHKLLENNPFYQEFYSGIEHTAKGNGLNIKIFNSRDPQSYEYISQQQSLKGIIVVGTVPVRLSLALVKLEIPIVIVDEYEYHPNFVTLTSEDEKGAFDSIEYLILKGHKKIAFVGCEKDRGNFVDKRIEGYKQALLSYNLPFRTKDIYLSEVNYNYEEGIRISQKIISGNKSYDAVFCTSDIMAIGLMKGFIKKGYRVPEDISIMGFDNIQFSKYSNPELTTVDQNIFMKAETAVTIILRKSQGDAVKGEYKLPVSIVERESVCKRAEDK